MTFEAEQPAFPLKNYFQTAKLVGAYDPLLPPYNSIRAIAGQTAGIMVERPCAR
jgi:hypothetical protein